MKLAKNIYLLAGLAIVGGLMTACSSSDDDSAEPQPEQKTVTVGALMDDLTASMASSITNALTGTTRAGATGYDISALGIPTTMPDEPAIPTDAKTLDETVPAYGDHSGVWVVPAGATYSYGSGSLNMANMTLYVAGTVNLDARYGSGVTIYVLKGGTLNILSDKQIFPNGGNTLYNYGTINPCADGIYLHGNPSWTAGDDRLYNRGTINLAGKKLETQGVFYTEGDLDGLSSYVFSNGNRTYIQGKLNMSGLGHIDMDGNVRVGGLVTADELTLINSGNLISDCGVVVKGKLKTNATNNLWGQYIHCGSLDQSSTAKIYLGDTGFLDIDGEYLSHNNSTATVELTSGPGTLAVVKAAKISFNGSGSPSTLNDLYCFATPNGGSLGVDCNVYDFSEGQGKDGFVVDMDGVDFKAATVQKITDANKSQFSISADACHGAGYNPKTPDDPDPKPSIHELVVVSDQHTHDISATCVQTDGTNVYVSFHQRGNGQSGCIERLTTTGDQTTLRQFVRDHNESIDFNHILLTSNRVYAVGNNKNGGFLGYLKLKSNGDLDVASADMNGLDSTDIARKTYAPLQLVKLQEAQANANKGYEATRQNSGDGNAVVLNNGVLQVASTYGFEFFNEDLEGLGTKHTNGKAKHIAVTPSGDIIGSYFTRQVTVKGDSLEEMPLRIEKYAASDTRMANAIVGFDANTVTPNNGKNVICEYDGKIYSCQGSKGLYVYNASDGSLAGHYAENVTTEDGKNLQICANGVTVDANYVYVAYGSRGLIVLDRSTLEEVTRFVSGRSANYVTLANGYIYVAYGRNNLKVFKLYTE